MNHGEHGEHGEILDVWQHPPGGGIIECDEQLIEKVLGAAIRVHRELGPGLLESIYELALMMELGEAGIYARKQVGVPIIYRGHDLGIGFRADIIVCDSLLLELKAVD